MVTPLLLALAATPSVELLSSVDGASPTPGWLYARVGQKVVLHAAVRGAGVTQVRWYKLEPTTGAVDNTTPSFHFEPIAYRETELLGCRDQLSCPADVVPTVFPEVPELRGCGTMAFQVRLMTDAGQALATPGLEATKFGGLTRAVHRVTFRRDDSLVGFASELLNTPYIFGSAGPEGSNQSDLLIGADCADLVIYARRRAGKKATYTSTYELERQAPALKDGQPVRAGDVVHFPNTRHVGLLLSDREPRGVLDDGDLVLHTCWAPPTVQPLGKTACGSRPLRVLRFPQ